MNNTVRQEIKVWAELSILELFYDAVDLPNQYCRGAQASKHRSAPKQPMRVVIGEHVSQRAAPPIRCVCSGLLNQERMAQSGSAFKQLQVLQCKALGSREKVAPHTQSLARLSVCRIS